jgi:hypothetical protein
MKKGLRPVLAVLFLFCFAAAASAELSISAGAGFTGKYLWRGEVLYDGFALQPAVSLGLNKINFNWWASASTVELNSDGSKQFNVSETDYTLSFQDAMPFISLLLVDAGYTIYTFPFSGPKANHSMEAYAGMTVDTLLSPYVRFYYDATLGNGGYVEAGASQSIPLGPAELAVSVNAGYNSEYKELYAPSLTAITANISLNYSLPGFKITPSLIAQYALDPQYKNLATGSITVNYEFSLGGEEKKE